MCDLSNNSTQDNDVELRLAYFSIIQNIIGRMSNSVLLMQTSNVTILSALLAFASTGNAPNFKWWMFFFPWALFTCYHAYFLHKENVFINLYNKSVTNNSFTLNDFKIEMSLIDEPYEFFKIFISKPSFSYFQVGLILSFILAFFLGVK